MDVVLDAHTTLAREVHAGLDSHDGADRKRIRVGLGQARRFMYFESQPVAERVAEGIAEATRLDQVARQRVGFAAGHPRPDLLAGARLRRPNQVIQRPLCVARPRADDHGAREVGAVAVDLCAEIDQQPVAGGQWPKTGTGMGERRPRARRYDRGEWMLLAPPAPPPAL